MSGVTDHLEKNRVWYYWQYARGNNKWYWLTHTVYRREYQMIQTYPYSINKATTAGKLVVEAYAGTWNEYNIVIQTAAGIK